MKINKDILNPHSNLQKNRMKLKPFFKFFCIFFVFCLFFMAEQKAFGQLVSANLTLPTPNSMSDGKRYYLANGTSVTYNFDVSVTNIGATGATDYDYFTITIPTETGNIVVTWNSDGAGAEVTGITPAGAGLLVGGAGTLNSGSWANGVVRFEVRFYWQAESTTNSSKQITAEVSDGTITIQDLENQSYGIASDIRVLNFVNNAPEADGYILPVTRAASFNVTGGLVYDLRGYTLESTSDVVADADITTVTLQLRNSNDNGLAWTHGTTDSDNNMSYTIPTAQNIPIRAQGYYWQASVDFAGAGSGADETSPADNRPSLESNQVEITNIRFLNGTGRGPTHSAPDNTADYYRGYGQAGTLIEVTAQMQVDGGSGQAMHGDTVFTVEYIAGVDSNNFNITLVSGSTVNTAAIHYDDATGFSNTWITDPETESWTYSIDSITGSSYGDDYTQTVANQVIIWDRNDPPPNSPASALTIQRESTSATSITLYWDPINTTSGSDDGDFYEYRVYFRENGSGDPYRQWDGDADSELRGLANNPWPAPTSTNNFDSNAWKYTTITGLKIYTNYDYYLTAIDVFGNETTSPTVNATTTKPYSVEVTLSDGITQYENESFADLTPDVRSLREANIKVDLTVITGDVLPDMVRVWYTTGDISTTPNIVTAINTINSSAFSQGTLSSANAENTGGNKWKAYLPTQTSTITYGNNVRFIVEFSLGGVSNFTDYEVEVPPNQNPNDDEWTFYIGEQTIFTPWPARVLNNVITDKDPIAYPAYYLTSDAFMTIKVYDIKGRPVATILDKVYRKGGQNIKEDGWRGLNKSRKKLGVGLYYVHFKAKRITDGKVILNKFKKVVIAK